MLIYVANGALPFTKTGTGISS